MGRSPGAPAKIAYVDHAAETGGAEKSLLDIIDRLDRSRFQPLLFCSEAANWLDEARPADVPVHRVFAPGGLLDRRRDELGALGSRDAIAIPRLVLRLYRALRRERPGLVHTNTLKTHLLGGAASHLARCPLIWHLRDILEEGNALKWLLGAARRFRPRIIAISEAVRRSLRGADVDIRVIHNGTDLSSFRPNPNRDQTRASLGLAPGDIAVAIVGRLTPWKGHQELLRAFAAAARWGSPIGWSGWASVTTCRSCWPPAISSLCHRLTSRSAGPLWRRWPARSPLWRRGREGFRRSW
jgi:glycosyltransferase involved in cell wall biosynthesis